MLREGLRLSLPERPCFREVMLRAGLRLRLPERPCCRGVMLREGLGLCLPERPCFREVMLRAGLRLRLPERPCRRGVMLRAGLRLCLPERPCFKEVFAGMEPSCWHLRASVQLWKRNARWEWGGWTTQVPHLPLFTQQVRTLGAETLVGMGKSGRALVHLQLFH